MNCSIMARRGSAIPSSRAACLHGDSAGSDLCLLYFLFCAGDELVAVPDGANNVFAVVVGAGGGSGYSVVAGGTGSTISAGAGRNITVSIRHKPGRAQWFACSRCGRAQAWRVCPHRDQPPLPRSALTPPPPPRCCVHCKLQVQVLFPNNTAYLRVTVGTAGGKAPGATLSSAGSGGNASTVTALDAAGNVLAVLVVAGGGGGGGYRRNAT